MIPVQIWKFMIKIFKLLFYYSYILETKHPHSLVNSSPASHLKDFLSLERPFYAHSCFSLTPLAVTHSTRCCFSLFGIFPPLVQLFIILFPFFVCFVFFTSIFRMMLFKQTFFCFCPNIVSNTVIDVYMKK